MRKELPIMCAVLVSLFLLFAAPLQAQTQDPVAVVTAYMTTANTGDFAATFAFYAENAVVRNAVGLFVGKPAIRQWLQQDVQTTRVLPKAVQANGNTVISTGMVSLARFKRLGIDAVAYRAEYRIEQGKIRFFSPTVLLTPAQQAQVQAGTPPSAAAGGDPAAIVKNYMNAVNSGNFERAFAFYADGAVVNSPLGLFVGRDAIGTWLRQDVQSTRATPNDFHVINGGTTVVSTGMVALPRFTAIGISQVSYRAEYLIEGDKIKYFSPTVLPTPAQQAQVSAAAGGSARPAAGSTGGTALLPATGGAERPRSIWMAVAGAIIVVSGLGISLRGHWQRR